MRRRIASALLIAGLVSLSAWALAQSYPYPLNLPVTWGKYSVNLPDGGVCLAPQSVQLDAGWGGFDGGVCADGGASCQACSGSCLVDAGWSTYTGLATSDPINGGLRVSVSCGLQSTVETAASVSVEWFGSCDQHPTLGGVWVPYVAPDGGQIGWTFTAGDGGSSTAGWAQFGAVYPDTEIQETAVSGDGGLVCCTASVQ